MSSIKIQGKSYEINSNQEEELKELLKDYKKTSVVEFKSFDLMQIIIGGIIFELAKKTFFNYKDMIFDIINKTS